MNQQWFVVSDSLWQRLEPHLSATASDAGATARNTRRTRKVPPVVGQDCPQETKSTLKHLVFFRSKHNPVCSVHMGWDARKAN